MAGALIVGASFTVIAGCAFGQEPAFESLSIDRPDVSNLPATVRPGSYQFETGFQKGHGKSLEEFHVPDMVFRTGLNSRSELRIGYDYLHIDSLDNGRADNMMFVMLGGKYRFLEERGSRPAIAFQAEFALPIGSGTGYDYDRDDYDLAAYSFLFLFSNTVSEQVLVNYNTGVFWSRFDRLDWLLSASFSFRRSHRLGYYLEVYSLILDNKIPVSFDGGLMLLVSPRVQLDIYGGQKAFESERLWIYGAGVGFRLDKGDLKPKSFSDISIPH